MVSQAVLACGAHGAGGPPAGLPSPASPTLSRYRPSGTQLAARVSYPACSMKDRSGPTEVLGMHPLTFTTSQTVWVDPAAGSPERAS
jgi:hypothetical protein